MKEGIGMKIWVVVGFTGGPTSCTFLMHYKKSALLDKQ